MTRITLLSAVSAVALIAAPALAQTSGSPQRGLGGPAPAAQPQQPKPDPMKQADVSKIEGSSVYGSDGKKIGSIAYVLMDPATKTINRFVVGAGGVLGVGAHDVAMPVEQFHWDGQKDGFVVNKTEADLKGMPAWNGSGQGGAMSGSSTAPGASTHAPAAAPPPTTAPADRH